MATDDLDNLAEHAGIDSLVSAPFLVDGTAPSVSGLDVRAERGRVVVKGLVADGLSPVDRVEVAVDYGDWELAFAGDGMFDSPSESFRLDVEERGGGGARGGGEGHRPGRELRARDARGALGGPWAGVRGGETPAGRPVSHEGIRSG